MRELSETVEMFYFLITVVSKIVCAVTILRTLLLKKVNFTVCKLYPKKSDVF